MAAVEKKVLAQLQTELEFIHRPHQLIQPEILCLLVAPGAVTQAQHGMRLLPQLYERYNPMTYKEAQAMEVELGIRLRALGYGVWQG